MNDSSNARDFPSQREPVWKQERIEEKPQQTALEDALQQDRLLKQVRAMMPRKTEHRTKEIKQ